MVAFHSVCKSNEVTEDCSRIAHEQADLDWDETEACVEDSFVGSGPRYRATNRYFENEKEYYQKYGPSFFPGLVINNRTYMGVLDPENVFMAICAGFKDSPSECKKHLPLNESVQGISMQKLLLIIVGLVVLNICLILCYRRYQKKEVGEQM